MFLCWDARFWPREFQQVATATAQPTRFPNLIAFMQFWKWVIPYLHDCFCSYARYQTYTDGPTGIFSLQENNGPLKIAVTADWGTGTLEAQAVTQNMKACDPHCTLHLGDVYYMGEAGEIHENYPGKPTRHYTDVSWPTGVLGSFAL